MVKEQIDEIVKLLCGNKSPTTSCSPIIPAYIKPVTEEEKKLVEEILLNG